MPIAANIWKLYLIRISKWFMLFMPIIVLFFEENGLSLKEVMLVNAAYAVAVAIFEIPSGYFSDRLGRKNAMIIGTILIALQFVLYSISFDFWFFCFGAVVGGLGVSFISGTDAALLYDTLCVLDKKEDYIKWEGWSYAIGTFSEAIAAIIGGWIAFYYGMRMTIYLQVLLSLLGVLVAFSLVEPPLLTEQKKNSKEQLITTLRYTFVENRRLLFLLFLSMIIGLASLLLAWFAQPYFDYHNMSEKNIGYWWALLNMIVALFSAQAHYIYRFLTNRKIAIGILIIFIVGYLGLGFGGGMWSVGIGTMFLMYAARGVSVPVFMDLINQQSNSDMRATVLSIKGFGIRIVFALVAPILGWVADVFTILEAFVCMGILVAALTAVSIIFYFVAIKK